MIRTRRSDAYEEDGKLGYASASTQNYRADSPGTAAAFAGVSRAVSSRRAKILQGANYDRGDFFEGDKAAEEDLKKRHSRNGKRHRAAATVCQRG